MINRKKKSFKDGIILQISLYKAFQAMYVRSRYSVEFDIRKKILLSVRDCRNYCLLYVKKKQNFATKFSNLLLLQYTYNIYVHFVN